MNPLLKEKILNFSSSLIFLGFLVATGFLVEYMNFTLKNISLLDTAVIIISTYRISRMLVYEKVFSLIRHILKTNSDKAIISSFNNLISCPWCTAVWISLFVFDIFYFVPMGNVMIYIISISGVAVPLVLLSNNISMKNDLLKKEKDK